MITQDDSNTAPAESGPPRTASAAEANLPLEPNKPVTAAGGERLAYIDTLRGVAVLSVFCCHIYTYWLGEPYYDSIPHPLKWFFGMGSIGVDLFIALSGFCLFYPIIRQGRPSEVKVNLRAFFRRRAYRILPTYYIVLAVTALLICIPSVQPWLVGRPINMTDVVSHVFLVQILSRSTIASINGSFWSIALECQLYLIFPALVFLYRRRGARGVLTAGLLLSVVWGVFAPHSFIERIMIGNYNLPARAIEFIFGMIAATLVSRPRQSQRAIALVIALIGTPIVVVVSHNKTIVPPSYVIFPAAGLVFAYLILALSAYPDRIFRTWPILRSVTAIGTFSYSFYLIHQTFLLLMVPPIHALREALRLSPAAILFISATTALLLLCLIAQAMFKTIEEPFHKKGKEKAKRSAIPLEPSTEPRRNNEPAPARLNQRLENPSEAIRPAEETA